MSVRCDTTAPDQALAPRSRGRLVTALKAKGDHQGYPLAL